MKSTRDERIVVILGPTASGKSDLAVALARRIGGEVISADSRQVYKGLDIGSGKITKREMRGIRHHLLDVASPRGLFTAARYRALARQAVAAIQTRGAIPIVCGGTGLYIDSLIYNTSLPHVKPNMKLRARLERQSAPQLYARLKKLDPRRAGTIERSNTRRLVRALEIVLATGKPVPELGERKYFYTNIKKIGIALPEQELKKRIRLRLARRLAQGMLREIARLHAQGVSWKRLDDLGLEYRYASRHLRGFISRAQMITEIEKESWRYARRQMTWWRKDKEIHWTKNPREGLAVATRVLS